MKKTRPDGDKRCQVPGIVGGISGRCGDPVSPYAVTSGDIQTGKACREHARQARYSLLELAAIAVHVETPGGVGPPLQVHLDNASALKFRIQRAQILECPQQEAGPEEQNKRQSDLRHDQALAEPSCARSEGALIT